MSLVFVRHGQASAGSDDYDRLSARGLEQSRRLGRWLADTGHEFDAVVRGGMKRHAESADALAEGYAASGRTLPEPRVESAFDEFDHRAVFDGFAVQFPDHPAVRAGREGGLPALGAMIHAALFAWSEAKIAGVPESWRSFGDRVGGGARRLAADGARRVLVVTSGGVIARMAQHSLELSDRGAVDLNLSLRNSGLCEFQRRPYGLALTSWNSVAHLHDAPELWTYY